jgi:Trk K+ transport system NAD-binding subunit
MANRSWLVDRKLRELELNREGILILGIYREVNGKEKYMGAPGGDTVIKARDTIICYGREEAIINLCQRIKGIAGDEQHKQAIQKEEKLEKIRLAQNGFD